MSSVFITGGTGKLGSKIVLYFARNGYNVAFQYFNTNPNRLIRQVESFGVRCIAYKCDLSVENQILIDQVIKDFSDLSILVNSASIFDKKTFQESDYHNYDKLFNIHVKNPIFLIKSFANLQNANLIINMSDSIIKKRIQVFFFIH